MPKAQLTFPPYGHAFVAKPTEDPFAIQRPEEWRDPETWKTWVDKVADLLAHVLWPRYDVSTGRWIGAAIESMQVLTEVDHALIGELRSYWSVAADMPDRMTHGELFALEDDHAMPLTTPWGPLKVGHGVDDTYRMYVAPYASFRDVQATSKTYKANAYRKFGSIHWNLKWAMQRPRPYQTALMLGRIDFRHVLAQSALTPAMISGHCFQTLVAGVTALYGAVHFSTADGFSVALQKHSIDAGDRRVFAGVHYPSDNISSWITTLLLLPQVFPSTRGHAWAVNAVREHSVVYKAIEAHRAAHADSAYHPSMQLLDFLSGHPEATVDEALAFVRAVS